LSLLIIDCSALVGFFSNGRNPDVCFVIDHFQLGICSGSNWRCGLTLAPEMMCIFGASHR
jgi:hypothetical protein